LGSEVESTVAHLYRVGILYSSLSHQLVLVLLPNWVVSILGFVGTSGVSLERIVGIAIIAHLKSSAHLAILEAEYLVFL
jgi:hypothetical protein